MVHAHPGRAGGDVDERVQDRPVGDRIRAVKHCLGLSVRRGNGARVEMVAPDDDRRANLPRPNELVDREARAGPVTEAEPADPGRQSLKLHPLRCELEPALKECVVGEKLQERRIDRCDIALVPRQRRPAERPDPAREERPDIGRDKARVCERILYACPMSLPTKIVAIIENIASRSDELEQAFDVACDRLSGTPEILIRVAPPQL